ncbi:MAG: chorismate synthase [Thermoprotei archaeon]|jgi:chorismate synthase
MFRVSLFGESHGKLVGVLIEGCPPGLRISEEDVQKELDKRKPGSSLYVSQRKEEDRVEILSGIFNGYTTGAPITMVVWNKDVISSSYEMIRYTPRPGHADYVSYIKYKGFNDYRGGGIFSGRITAGLVMAGAVAKKLLSSYNIEVYSYITSIGPIESPLMTLNEIKENVYKSPVRCPHAETSNRIEDYIKTIMKEGDSVGGIIETIVLNVPVGLGEPPIDTLDGDLAKAMFIIPAIKGIEFGAGFKLSKMKGSESNDPYIISNNKIVTLTNNAGGINGGISNGMPIIFRVVVKPTSSIRKKQRTVDLLKMEETELIVEGRHDPCIAIRAVPVVESVTAIVVADHLLRWLSWSGKTNS